MEQRKGLENIDQFAAAPPGIGMMTEQGGYPWERPAKTSNPEEAANNTIEKIDNNPSVKEEMLNLMSVGSPIETIVNTISFIGFVNGEWTPDTAELIKPTLMVYFIGAALDNNIEATVYNVPEDEKERTSDEDLVRIMRDFKPDEFTSSWFINTSASDFEFVLQVGTKNGGPVGEIIVVIRFAKGQMEGVPDAKSKYKLIKTDWSDLLGKFRT